MGRLMMYSPEVRERAVRLVLEHRSGSSRSVLSCRSPRPPIGSTSGGNANLTVARPAAAGHCAGPLLHRSEISREDGALPRWNRVRRLRACGATAIGGRARAMGHDLARRTSIVKAWHRRKQEFQAPRGWSPSTTCTIVVSRRINGGYRLISLPSASYSRKQLTITSFIAENSFSAKSATHCRNLLGPSEFVSYQSLRSESLKILFFRWTC